MTSRILLTSLLWFVGASTAMVFVGQTYTNSLILMVCCVVVAGFWSPLLCKKPRPTRLVRLTAILIIGANLLLILWAWSRIPEARRFQDQFNIRQEQGSDAVQLYEPRYKK